MVIFHSYVKLPEGTCPKDVYRCPWETIGRSTNLETSGSSSCRPGVDPIDPMMNHNLRFPVDEKTPPSPEQALQRPFKGPSKALQLRSIWLHSRRDFWWFLEIAEIVGSSCPTNASSLISSKDASNCNFEDGRPRADALRWIWWISWGLTVK